MPGGTASRSYCQGSYCFTIQGSSGRGPIRLISSRRTFTSCGSSSRLVARSQRPTRVTRGSSRNLCTGLPSTSRTTANVCASASWHMVRNLRTRNLRPPSPTRSCENRTGPGESSLTVAAIRSMAGARMVSTTAETTRSTARLTIRWAPVSAVVVTVSTGTPATISVVVRRVARVFRLGTRLTRTPLHRSSATIFPARSSPQSSLTIRISSTAWR